jgi:hypothetical protein
MSAKDLIADIYNTHCKDHTASDFEICRNPLCEMAREAELSIAALQARVAELEKLLHESEGFIGYLACHIDADEKEIQLHANILAALGMSE